MHVRDCWFIAASLAIGQHFDQQALSCKLLIEPDTVATRQDTCSESQTTEIIEDLAEAFREIYDNKGLWSQLKNLPSDEARTLNVDEDRSCAPTTYLQMPTDDIFSCPFFGIHADSVIIDIGAGAGRAVASAVVQYGAQQGVGIEFSETRWRT